MRVKGLFLLHEKLLHLSILLPEYLTRVYEAWWGFDHPNSLRASPSPQHPCLLSRLSPHQYKGLSHSREKKIKLSARVVLEALSPSLMPRERLRGSKTKNLSSCKMQQTKETCFLNRNHQYQCSFLLCFAQVNFY